LQKNLLMANKNRINYDEEPVCYCVKCLSLAIVEEDDIAYCKKCGCSVVGIADINTWKKLKDMKYPPKITF